MLGMNDKSMLIAMPTKCGTERLKRTLVRETKVAIELPEDHGLKIYPGYAKKVLLVRDPLARWVSTYWWLKATESNQGFGKLVGEHLGTFAQFAKVIASRPSKAFVFKSLDEYVEKFQPDIFIALEKLIPNWTNWFDSSWLEAYQKVAPHATKFKKSVEETVKKLPKDFVTLLEGEYKALGKTYKKTV